MSSSPPAAPVVGPGGSSMAAVLYGSEPFASAPSQATAAASAAGDRLGAAIGGFFDRARNMSLSDKVTKVADKVVDKTEGIRFDNWKRKMGGVFDAARRMIDSSSDEEPDLNAIAAAHPQPAAREGSPPADETEGGMHASEYQRFALPAASQQFFNYATTASEPIVPVLMPLRSTDDPLEDVEALQSLDEKYYQSRYDGVRAVLERLPALGDEATMDAELRHKQRALRAVSAKLADSVFTKHDDFMEQLDMIAALEEELASTVELCKTSRQLLATSERELVAGGMAVLTKYQKRTMLTGITAVLKQMEGAVQTYEMMRTSLDSGDYAEAYRHCKNCEKEAQRFKNLEPMRLLADAMQDTMKEIQLRVEQALARLCRVFDATAYQRILNAYESMRTMQYVVFKLPEFLEDAVKQAATQALVAFVPSLNSPTSPSYPSFGARSSFAGSGSSQQQHDRSIESKAKYRELLTRIEEDRVQECLKSMFAAFVDLMHSHHAMLSWHRAKAAQDTGGTKRPPSVGAPASRGAQLSDIEVSLDRCRQTMWEAMQRRIAQFLSAVQFTHLKVEQFLALIDTTNHFIKAGDEFSGSDSNLLRRCIKEQSMTYFEHYHHETIEAVHTMVMNETWQRSPVPIGFNVSHIKELRAASSKVLANLVVSDTGRTFLQTGSNPFRTVRPQRERPSIGTGYPNDDVDEEELVDIPQDDELYEKQEDGITPVGRTPDGFDTVAGPVVVPTSLRVIRTIGRYVNMMEILSPIAAEAFHGLSYLVDMYIYTVFSLFALSPTHTTDMQDWFVFSSITPRLRNLLVHLRDEFVTKAAPSSPGMAPGVEIGAAGGIAVNHAVQELLNAESSMFGLVLRTVATESLLFVCTVLNLLKTRILRLLPKSELEAGRIFFSRSVDLFPELRQHMYLNICTKFLPLDGVKQLILDIRWDNLPDKEDRPPFNPYVNVLVKELALYMDKVSALDSNGVPLQARTGLWEAAITHGMQTLVESYSKVSRCPKDAYDQMKQDLLVLVAALEARCTVRPIPAVDYVQNYIVGFAIPETELLDWVGQHMEYSMEQIGALVHNGTCSNMKSWKRDELLEKIAEMREAANKM